VIGSGIAKALYPSDPVGQILRVNHLGFRIVGVLEGTGLGLDGSDLGQLVVIPLEFTPRYDALGRRGVSWVTVQGRAGTSSSQTVATIQDVVRDRHRVTTPRDSDVDVLNLAAIGETAASIGHALSAGFFIVASISLLVGGIGIMNVMLAGAAERTHEVGIRLAIGATPATIFVQYLLESVLICLGAALTGELFACVVAALISASGTLTLRVTLSQAAIGAACAGAIGTIFGLYPARKAARVSPNLALRVR